MTFNSIKWAAAGFKAVASVARSGWTLAGEFLSVARVGEFQSVTAQNGQAAA